MPRSERVRRQGLEPRTRGLRVRSFLCCLVPFVLASPKHRCFVPVDGATVCRLVPLVLPGLWRPSTHGAPTGRGVYVGWRRVGGACDTKACSSGLVVSPPLEPRRFASGHRLLCSRRAWCPASPSRARSTQLRRLIA